MLPLQDCLYGVQLSMHVEGTDKKWPNFLSTIHWQGVEIFQYPFDLLRRLISDNLFP